MAYVRLNVDVDIDMSEFEADELIAELDRRGKSPTNEVDHDAAKIGESAKQRQASPEVDAPQFFHGWSAVARKTVGHEG